MTPEEAIRSVVKLSKNMTRPVYRGQANRCWQLLSSALRRLQDAYGEDFPKDKTELHKLVTQYHMNQLIEPMKVIDGSTLSDLQRLSVLQHQGAATGLLDFTEHPLVALWFACAELFNRDGKVFVLDIGDHQVAKNGRLMDDPFRERQLVVYYEPDRSLGARIIAQQSVFVIGNPHISEQYFTSVVIPKQSKKKLLEYLTSLGLSERVLFGDIPGLAAANTAKTKLQPTGPLSPKQYRDRGNRAYQEGRFDDALTAYESYANALPNVAEPYCLKGDALAQLGRFEEANLAYTNAIENLDQPIYLGEQVILNSELANMMSRALYYNRGNVRAATGDHQGAVADFDIALQRGFSPKMDLLYNRGNSKFALGKYEEAHEDFESTWLEQEGSGAALAIGNCKVMMGLFEEAFEQYLNGATFEHESSATHCRINEEQVQKLMRELHGKDFQVRREGVDLFIETEGATGHFQFAGNRGNTGNIPSGMGTAPGGKGYVGVKGFAVSVIVPPIL